MSSWAITLLSKWLMSLDTKVKNKNYSLYISLPQFHGTNTASPYWIISFKFPRCIYLWCAVKWKGALFNWKLSEIFDRIKSPFYIQNLWTPRCKNIKCATSSIHNKCDQNNLLGNIRVICNSRCWPCSLSALWRGAMTGIYSWHQHHRPHTKSGCTIQRGATWALFQYKDCLFWYGTLMIKMKDGSETYIYHGYLYTHNRASLYWDAQWEHTCKQFETKSKWKK